MYLEMTLNEFQKERLEKTREKIEEEIFWIPDLRNKIKDELLKNKTININSYDNWGTTYYEALFAALLVTKNPSVIKVGTIIKAIRPRDPEFFFFFVKDILAEKNPVCIEDSPTKQLMLAIIKKKT